MYILIFSTTNTFEGRTRKKKREANHPDKKRGKRGKKKRLGSPLRKRGKGDVICAMETGQKGGGEKGGGQPYAFHSYPSLHAARTEKKTSFGRKGGIKKKKKLTSSSTSLSKGRGKKKEKMAEKKREEGS